MATLLPNGRMQICGYSGTPSIWGPLVGGMIYTYAAGTSTPKATYTTAAANVENENPVVLDARGEATIFWNGAYKIVVRDADDNILYTVDNVSNSVSAANVSYADTTIAFILLDGISYAVDSIDALRDVDSLYFTNATVKGYYIEGDGGGGQYYLDSADTTSADNGGSIIVASDSARWKLLNYGRPYSVLQFGAVPDGATDSSTEIQAAIDAAEDDGVNAISIDGAILCNSDIESTTCSFFGSSSKYYDGANATKPLSDFSSVLLLDRAATITLNGTVLFDKIIVAPASFYTGGAHALPFANSTIANAALAAFSGTAIDCNNHLSTISNCAILGYSQAIANCGYVNNSDIDCLNGISGDSNSQLLHIGNRVDSFTTRTISGATKTRSGFAVQHSTSSIAMEGCHHAYYDGGSQIADPVLTNCYLYSEGDTFSPLTCGAGSRTEIEVSLRGCYIEAAGNTVSPVNISTGVAYLIDRCTMKNSTAPYAVKLDSGAGYGHITNCTAAIPSVGGDATAVLKCIVSTPLQAHVPATFTPVLEFGAGTTGITYAIQKGFYTVHDNLVTCFVHIQLTAKGSSTGAAAISGLPYTSSAVAGCYGGAAVQYYENFDTLVGALSLVVDNSSTKAFFRQENLGANTSTDAITHTSFKNSTIVRATFSYFIDR